MAFRMKFLSGSTVPVVILLLSAVAFSQTAEQITYSFTGKSGS